LCYIHRLGNRERQVAEKTRSQQGKYWYKVSVDALRMWAVLVVLAVLATVGYGSYSLLHRHFTRRQVEVTMDEARDLVLQLAREKGLLNFRLEYANAKQGLEEAVELLRREETSEALIAAERSRTLLLSILDTLRHRGSTGVAQFIAVQGGVEYRRGERGDWQPARSRVVLFPGDYVMTTGGGSAEVMTVEGALFTVRPDTVILVDRSDAEAGVPSERTIALESGWVNLSTAQTASRIATPEAETRVPLRSEASVAYDEQSRQASFTAVRGEIEVTARDGGRRRIGENHQVMQRGEGLSQPRRLPDAPLALEPRDNQEVFLAETDRLILAWDPVERAQGYSLQISRNRLFVDNLIDVEGRRKTRATVGLRGEGLFVWRVAAIDGSGALGPWSAPRRFRVSGARLPIEETLQEEQGQEDPRAVAPGGS